MWLREGAIKNLWKRISRALPWFWAGVIAVCLVVWGMHRAQERFDWSVYNAEVVSTDIKWASHMSDEYALFINLLVHSDSGQDYSASLFQAGSKGALEHRAQTIYAQGKIIRVQVNPKKPSDIVLAGKRHWSVYLWAGVVGFFFLANAMTVLNQHNKQE